MGLKHIWLAILGFSYAALHALALAVKEYRETGLDVRDEALSPDPIYLTGLAVIGISALISIILNAITKHSPRVDIPGKYLQTNGPAYPASAWQAIDSLVKQTQKSQPNTRFVAAKAFVPVTGLETLGAPGSDWSSAWVPVQTSPTEATTFVVWWTYRRGAVLTVHSTNQSEYALSAGVGMMSQPGSLTVHL
ncbi:hypothetical protein ONZ45_g7849 [Pleurotus djamor]|nr:hypothetical protein ONZ45_g7849 [Pleurotus djamor]